MRTVPTIKKIETETIKDMSRCMERTLRPDGQKLYAITHGEAAYPRTEAPEKDRIARPGTGMP